MRDKSGRKIYGGRFHKGSNQLWVFFGVAFAKPIINIFYGIGHVFICCHCGVFN